MKKLKWQRKYLYNDTFIKAFDTLKAAKAYAETLGVETYE